MTDGEMAIHYGPTATDPDPGAMWHTDCGGRVLIIDGGHICDCGAQEEIESQLSYEEARAILDNHIHEFKWVQPPEGWTAAERFHCSICGVGYETAIGRLAAELTRDTRCDKPGCTDRARFQGEACIGSGGPDGEGIYAKTVVCGLHGRHPMTLGWAIRRLERWDPYAEAIARTLQASPLPHWPGAGE